MNAFDRLAWLHRIAITDGVKLAALKVAAILADFCNSSTGKANPGLQARLGRDVTTDGARWLRDHGFVVVDRDAYRGEPAVYLLTMPTVSTGAEKGQEGTANSHTLKGQEGTANSPQRYGKKGQEGTANSCTQPLENHGENQERHGGGESAAPLADPEDPFTATPAEVAKAMAPAPTPEPAAPVEVSWLDWRRDHPRVGIARTGEDGDTEAWRGLWDHYGPECFDLMYRALARRLKDPSKRIWYGQAAQWLNENTMEVA